ncbi:MAG TPA: hypothetical protein VM802_10205 [Chitinophaga sp.]|uniref:hypothetical protein n=1 Tax=Chitinophaga sp. TaxID=1869181 RepID=UPI002B84BCEE|nr:hypothetical protein [Chitinophaga sp.]HVI45235.1 hypothetical protein [Chitinophaga sp.]
MLLSNILHHEVSIQQQDQISCFQINIPQGTTAITGIETGIRMKAPFSAYRGVFTAGQLQLFTQGSIDRCNCQYVTVPQINTGGQELGYTHYRSGFTFVTALEKSGIAQSWYREPDQLILPYTPIIYGIYKDQLAGQTAYIVNIYLWLTTDDQYKQSIV